MNRVPPDTSNAVRTTTWTCPLCDESNTRIGLADTFSSKPLSSLKNHIKSNDDERHGNRHEFPDDLDVASLDDHITNPTPVNN